VTPLQALYFMNAGFPKSCAVHLADSLPHGEMQQKEQITGAFETILNRAPDAEELAQSREFLRKTESFYEAHGVAGDQARKDALSKWIEVLYASNEFIFLD
jgi:hypothetical protein